MAQDYRSIKIVWLQGQLSPSLSQMQHDALPLFMSMGSGVPGTSHMLHDALPMRMLQLV